MLNAVLLVVLPLLGQPQTVPVSKCDLLRFPGREFCAIQIRMNREHGKWLEANRMCDPRNRNYWSARMVENDKLWMVWFRLDDAVYYNSDSPFGDVHPWFHWSCLEHFRFLVGEENYWSGRMPPATESLLYLGCVTYGQN